MSALCDDEVLLACGSDGLRVFSLRTAQLSATVIRDHVDVRKVAFDAHTDTLLLLVEPSFDEYTAGRVYWELMSLRRDAGEWREVQRLQTDFQTETQFVTNIVVCDSRVLLGTEKGCTVYMFEVSANHTFSAAGSVALQTEFNYIACTRLDGDTLVAFSHATSFSLQRLTSQGLEPLARVNLTYAYWLLFRGDLLFVGHINSTTKNTDAILTLRASSKEPTEQPLLFNARAGVRVRAVALAGDRLVLWDWKSKDLFVYAFA